MENIRVKRVYDPVDPGDGTRVLVDRLWPRGFTKEKLRADLWLKEIAPSNALRTWFHQDRSQWQEFKARYTAELDGQPEAVAKLLDLAAKGPVTLLYAARDLENNHVVVLAEYLNTRSNK
jgi:uncharacterized protein YeaO (DUF488 family)